MQSIEVDKGPDKQRYPGTIYFGTLIYGYQFLYFSGDKKSTRPLVIISEI